MKAPHRTPRHYYRNRRRRRSDLPALLSVCGIVAELARMATR